MKTVRAKLHPVGVPVLDTLGNVATWQPSDIKQINKLVEPEETSLPECQLASERLKLGNHHRENRCGKPVTRSLRAREPRYLLILRSEPSDIPIVIRLRKLLKLILRAFRFRVVECREVTAGSKLADKLKSLLTTSNAETSTCNQSAMDDESTADQPTPEIEVITP